MYFLCDFVDLLLPFSSAIQGWYLDFLKSRNEKSGLLESRLDFKIWDFYVVSGLFWLTFLFSAWTLKFSSYVVKMQIWTFWEVKF
jgi:hypothetical protein